MFLCAYCVISTTVVKVACRVNGSICHLKLYKGQIRGDQPAAYTSHYFQIVRYVFVINIKTIIIIIIFIPFFFRTGVNKCQDFRSPFGALVDCNNQTHTNCSDEQRLLYFLMKYEIYFSNLCYLLFNFSNVQKLLKQCSTSAKFQSTSTSEIRFNTYTDI